MELTGPLGAIIGVAFLALWIFGMISALMMLRHSNSPFRWFIAPPPRASLTPEGLRWRRWYIWTVIAAFTLVALAFIVLPSQGSK